MLPKDFDYDNEVRKVGAVGVDSASLNVKICIGDLMKEHEIQIDNRFMTPEGDGVYSILAGKNNGNTETFDDPMGNKLYKF